MSLRDRRIVVTGGAGFIGSHLIDRLLADDAAEVVAFDNLSRGRRANVAHLISEQRFRLFEADVRDYVALAQAFQRADLIYHLAAQPTVIGAVRDAELTYQTNVFGTFNVLRAAVEARVPRVVFASSR